MKKTTFGLALLCLLTATSCKKEKGEEKIQLNTTTVSGNYKVTAITMLTGTVESDVRPFFMEPCEYDDIIQFKTDKTFMVTDAGMKCSPASNETGTWDLPGNNKFILDGEETEVKKWDGKELHLSAAETINSQPTTITFKLEKQ